MDFSQIYNGREVFMKLKEISLSKETVDDHSQFNSLLKPIHENAICMREANDYMPEKYKIPAGWLTGAIPSSSHIQTLRDLEILFVVLPGGIKVTLGYYSYLLKLTHKNCDICDLTLGGSEITIHKSGYSDYQPGIYRLRINLLAYWRLPANELSIDSISAAAVCGNILLTGIESYAASIMQKPELLPLQDGTILPRCDMAGIRIVGRDGEPRVPTFGFNSNTNRIFLDSSNVHAKSPYRSVPVILAKTTAVSY